MADDQVSTFKLPNREGLAKVSGNIFKLAIIGALGFAAYVFLLPFLLTIVWGTVELAIGIPIAAFLLYVLSNKKLWRAITYYSQFIAEKILSLAIEMNPFSIMENQIDKADEDRQDLHKQAVALKGQQAKLQQDMITYDATMKQSAREIQIVNKSVASTSNPDEKDRLGMQLETCTNTYTGAKDYIDSVKPILDSINLLVTFADKAYDKSGNALQNARQRVKMMRDKWDAVTTGSRAMAKAQAAFEGRPELNADSEKAMDFLRKDIGNKIGAIRESIKITSNIMDSKDLADAAKAQEAADSAKQFNLDDKFKYSATLTDTSGGYSVPGVNVSEGNKYLNLLK